MTEGRHFSTIPFSQKTRPYVLLDDKCMSNSSTIVAQATAPGEASIAMVRLSGPQALSFLQKIFRKKKLKNHPLPSRGRGEDLLFVHEGGSWEDFETHKMYFGEIMIPHPHPSPFGTGVKDGTNNIPLSPLGERVQGEGVVLDQAMVVFMKAPHSFTGEDVAEIHMHGSPVVVEQVLKILVGLGATSAKPGEFSKRAFLNGKMDLSQAEAIADLIASKSELAAKNALSQLGGNLSRLVESLRQDLIQVMSRLELGFDFIEEDVALFNPKECLLVLEKIKTTSKRLLASFQTGQLYKHGLKIALVGKPNVGKSSLLNAFLEEDKAITHSEPGTTRDVVMGEIKLSGIPIQIYDTAGLREAAHPVEQEGIKRSENLIEKADLVLVILDSSNPLTLEDHQILEKIKLKKHLKVANKIDLKPGWDLKTVGDQIFSVSAVTSQGLNEILEEIQKLFLKGSLEIDSGFVLNNVRHQKILQEVLVQVENVGAGLSRPVGVNNYSPIPEELLAEELRLIARLLGNITGEVKDEHILDEIFSKFCIGK